MKVLEKRVARYKKNVSGVFCARADMVNENIIFSRNFIKKPEVQNKIKIFSWFLSK
jgi:hypothetical protein